MGLVKQNQGGRQAMALSGGNSSGSDGDQRRKGRATARQPHVAESVSTLSSALSQGISEVLETSKQLGRKTEQMAVGASEVGTTAKQSLEAMQIVAGDLDKVQEISSLSQTRTQDLQGLLQVTSTEIAIMVDHVGLAADRQTASGKMVAEMERQAKNIEEIAQTCGQIADQSTLLALNAVIEAARAGQNGQGFSVVAREVQTLAANAERNAAAIQKIVTQIQGGIGLVREGVQKAIEVSSGEVKKGESIHRELETIRVKMESVCQGAAQISQGTEAAAKFSHAVLKDVQDSASVATTQVTVCQEARKAVEQQTEALSQSEEVAQELDELVDQLESGTNRSAGTEISEGAAPVAEELAVVLKEINRFASRILTAAEQISQGTRQQTRLSDASDAVTTKIQDTVTDAKEQANEAVANGLSVAKQLDANKTAVEAMVQGISEALASSQKDLARMMDLKSVGRQIDKTVEAISNVALQGTMLAVDGAVEAARAGEYGKGFSKVSSNLRTLAQESLENAGQLKDHVKALQDQIGLVMHDREDIGRTTLLEVEKAKGVTEKLQHLETGMKVVLEGNHALRDVAGTSVGKIDALKKGVQEISRAAQEAANDAEEIVGTAAEQLRDVQRLTAVIEDIVSRVVLKDKRSVRAISDRLEGMVEELRKGVQQISSAAQEAANGTEGGGGGEQAQGVHSPVSDREGMAPPAEGAQSGE